MTSRWLVMGDNHGDTEAFERLLDDINGTTFDGAIHVGDLTDGVRAGRETAASQLQSIEPYLEAIDEQTRYGLVWIWGNRDYFGDIDADLNVGTHVPPEGCVTVGGTRFTNELSAVSDDVVLLTHMEYWRLLDHFDGVAHFCGNTHLGRHLDNRLNSAFLQYTPRDGHEQRYGGYFVVALNDSGIVDVEMHSIGQLSQIDCAKHGERGVQYHAAFDGCMYCAEPDILRRELTASAYYGLTHGAHRDAVADETLIEYAIGLWDDPPAGLQAELQAYLESIDTDRYAPLTRADDGRLTLASESYAY